MKLIYGLVIVVLAGFLWGWIGDGTSETGNQELPIAARKLFDAKTDIEFLSEVEKFEKILNALDPSTMERPETRKKKKELLDAFQSTRTKAGTFSIPQQVRENFLFQAVLEDSRSAIRTGQSGVNEKLNVAGSILLLVAALFFYFFLREYRLKRLGEKYIPSVSGGFYPRFQGLIAFGYERMKSLNELEIEVVDLQRLIRVEKRRRRVEKEEQVRFEATALASRPQLHSGSITVVTPPTEQFPALLPSDLGERAVELVDLPEDSNALVASDLNGFRLEERVDLLPQSPVSTNSEIADGSATANESETSEAEPVRNESLMRVRDIRSSPEDLLPNPAFAGLNFDSLLAGLDGEEGSKDISPRPAKADQEQSPVRAGGSPLLNKLLTPFASVPKSEEQGGFDGCSTRRELIENNKRVIRIRLTELDVANFKTMYGESFEKLFFAHLVFCLKKQSVKGNQLAYEDGEKTLYWAVRDNDTSIEDWEEYLREGYEENTFRINGQIVDVLPDIALSNA